MGAFAPLIVGRRREYPEQRNCAEEARGENNVPEVHTLTLSRVVRIKAHAFADALRFFFFAFAACAFFVS